MQGLGSRVQVAGFEMQGVGCRVSGVGLRVASMGGTASHRESGENRRAVTPPRGRVSRSDSVCLGGGVRCLDLRADGLSFGV